MCISKPKAPKAPPPPAPPPSPVSTDEVVGEANARERRRARTRYGRGATLLTGSLSGSASAGPKQLLGS